MSFRRCALAWVLVGGLLPMAQATIYAHTDEDGGVTLSNVPSDARFTVLIPAPGQAVATVARPPAAGAPGPRSVPRARSKAFDGLIEEVARTHGLQSSLLHAVVGVESAYNPAARSPKGAAGLMQLMPQTAQRYGVKDAFDARQNLEGGARYLRDLLRLFDDRLELALAAYNAGENAVLKHGMRVPPYRETLGYVPRVIESYERHLRNPAGPGADR